MDATEARRQFELGQFLRNVVEGKESLLNYKEYDVEETNIILTKFTNVIETISQKQHNNYYVDLEKNKSKIWDLLFLNKVIEQQIDPRLKNNIETDIDRCVLLNSSEIINPDELEGYKELQKSILTSRRIRNSRNHGSTATNTLITENKIQYLHIINNHPSSLIDCKIPLSYLYEFGNGIKPLDIHLQIKEEVTNLTSNIFFRLGFELKEIPNFMYNVHPSRMKSLLELVNYDMDMFSKLPSGAFYYDEEKIKFLWEMVKEDINVFSKLPSGAFMGEEKRINLLWGMAKEDINAFSKLPSGAFTCKTDQINLLWEMVKEDINVFSKLRHCMFACGTDRINLLWGMAKGDKKTFFKLPSRLFTCKTDQINLLWRMAKEDIDTFSKLPVGAFTCKTDQINLLWGMAKEDIDTFSKLPYYVFLYKEDQINLLWGMAKGDKKTFSKLPSSAFKCEVDRINLLWGMAKEDMDVFSKIPSNAFNCKEEIIEFFWKKVKDDIIAFSKIPNRMFINETDRIEFLWEMANGVVDVFSKLPASVFTCDKERINLLLQKVNNNIDKFCGLSDELFECKEELIDELLKLQEENMLYSMLGMGNEKVTAITILMNSIFSNYEEKNLDFTTLDMTFDKIQLDKLEELIEEYREKHEKEMNERTNIEQIVNDDKIPFHEKEKRLKFKLDKLQDVVKQTFIREIIKKKKEKVMLLRNCAAHCDIYVDPNNPNNVLLKHFHDGQLKYEKSFVIEDFIEFLLQILENQLNKSNEINRDVKLEEQLKSIEDNQVKIIQQEWEMRTLNVIKNIENKRKILNLKNVKEELIPVVTKEEEIKKY